jgi:hypothetical protein
VIRAWVAVSPVRRCRSGSGRDSDHGAGTSEWGSHPLAAFRQSFWAVSWAFQIRPRHRFSSAIAGPDELPRRRCMRTARVSARTSGLSLELSGLASRPSSLLRNGSIRPKRPESGRDAVISRRASPGGGGRVDRAQGLRLHDPIMWQVAAQADGTTAAPSRPSRHDGRKCEGGPAKVRSGTTGRTEDNHRSDPPPPRMRKTGWNRAGVAATIPGSKQHARGRPPCRVRTPPCRTPAGPAGRHPPRNWNR